MDQLLDNHRRACEDFSLVANRIPPDRWEAPTPCTDWDARALVEHVIGFHEFLLLRPLGVRAHRPRDDPAARWHATATAMFDALSTEGTLDRTTELPGGGSSTPRTMLAALTTDVVIHTWDLGRAAGLDVVLDPLLCTAAYEAAMSAGVATDAGMVGPEIAVGRDADVQTKLLGLYGRDPSWTAPGPE